MTTIVVRVEPDDPDAWYADHMAQVENFRAAGVTSEVMLRDVNQPNARVGILEVEDAERFFAFLRAPGSEGPAKYQPTMWVLEEIERTI